MNDRGKSYEGSPPAGPKVSGDRSTPLPFRNAGLIRAGGLATALVAALVIWQPWKEQKVAVAMDPKPQPQLKQRQSFEPEMVRIPGGTFSMGCVSGKGCEDNEKPVHRVTIKPFEMAKFEVTFAEWDACVADGDCTHKPKTDWGRGRQPVINVSWDDVQKYIRWLNKKTRKRYRLPSEAEWEYAARAGTMTEYAFGDTISKSQAQFSEDSHGTAGKTVEVGSFRANVFGLNDMHGNVWEFTRDCWNDSYRKMPIMTKQSGAAWTTGNCSRRVVRGGSWYYGPRSLRSANRDWYASNVRLDYRGFRLARSLGDAR